MSEPAQNPDPTINTDEGVEETKENGLPNNNDDDDEDMVLEAPPPSDAVSEANSNINSARPPPSG